MGIHQFGGALQLANAPQIRGYLHQFVNIDNFVEHFNILDFLTLISEASTIYVKFEPIQPVFGLEIMGKIEISVKNATIQYLYRKIGKT